MQAGSTLRNATNIGVSVGSGGRFTMSGGTISGNTASLGGGVYVIGSFTMNGGTISGNTASGGSGGGVCVVSYRGRFVKRGGGTIDAANSAQWGRAVYVDSSPKKERNNTAGPSVNLDSGIAGRDGGWE